MENSNVISLRSGQPIARGASNPHLISWLEQLTEEAKAGRLHALAVLVIDGAGQERHMYRAPQEMTLQMGGALMNMAIEFSMKTLDVWQEAEA